MSITVDGYKSSKRPKNRWMDCVKDDMARKGMATEVTTYREIRKKGYVGRNISLLGNLFGVGGPQINCYTPTLNCRFCKNLTVKTCVE